MIPNETNSVFKAEFYSYWLAGTTGTTGGLLVDVLKKIWYPSASRKVLALVKPAQADCR